MVERKIGSVDKILETSDGMLTVNIADPEPDPIAPYTSVLLILTMGETKYYVQQLVKDGVFTPI